MAIVTVYFKRRYCRRDHCVELTFATRICLLHRRWRCRVVFATRTVSALTRLTRSVRTSGVLSPSTRLVSLRYECRWLLQNFWDVRWKSNNPSKRAPVITVGVATECCKLRNIVAVAACAPVQPPELQRRVRRVPLLQQGELSVADRHLPLLISTFSVGVRVISLHVVQFNLLRFSLLFSKTLNWSITWTSASI